ncbi:hypothetical protein BGZ61DRAFT_455567 [Ilyonectria robusta]|uniref:uncharacterized protein n=1 Tax=Ilyonectria robusta TaxID=1079257 RepID=UPI001E8E66EB|nr:uncharacterized protein BGZ61DRAFT_455567 [Ilyonectria robusta]KAH8684045.1 hypothetical protein BGZ61DRAFT_455567 [Ilyonectria robusta]
MLYRVSFLVGPFSLWSVSILSERAPSISRYPYTIRGPKCKGKPSPISDPIMSLRVPSGPGLAPATPEYWVEMVRDREYHRMYGTRVNQSPTGMPAFLHVR